MCSSDLHSLIADYSEIESLQYNKTELVQWMVMAKSFTRNEIREAVGYQRIETDEMDKVYDSVGTVPVDQLGLMPSGYMSEEVLKALNIHDYRQ